MSFWQLVILSIIEGITEFLPISSTGHMILASHAMGLEKTPELILFEIVTQFGATLAIVALFAKKLLTDGRSLFLVGIAFIPTGIIGLTLYQPITSLFTIPTVSVISLVIGGILLIYFDQKRAKCEKSIALTIPRAFAIGFLQCLAFIPGTSRSAATILAGMMLGLSRRDAAEFSFLLAIPTMAAASGYALLKFEGELNTQILTELILGSLIAFWVAYFSVKIFMHYIERFGLTFFGIYRIVFALIYYMVFLR